MRIGELHAFAVFQIPERNSVERREGFTFLYDLILCLFFFVFCVWYFDGDNNLAVHILVYGSRSIASGFSLMKI